MKNMTLSAEAKSYFDTHSYLELEEVFEADELAALHEEILSIMKKRLRVPSDRFDTVSPIDLFCAGRGTYLESDLILKKIASRKMGTLIASLTRSDTIRLAFDQVLLPSSPIAGTNDITELSNLSCIKEITCALIVPLSASVEAALPHFSCKLGNVLALHRSLTLCWRDLFPKHTNGIFYVIAYGPEKLLYQKEGRDPATHALKNIGPASYGFGSKLLSATHPLIHSTKL